MLQKIASTYIKENDQNKQNTSNTVLDQIYTLSEAVTKAFSDGYNNITANNAESGHQRIFDESANALGQVFWQGKSYNTPDIDKFKNANNITLLFTGAWDGSQNGSHGVFTPKGGNRKVRDNVIPFRFNDINEARAFLEKLNKHNKGIKVNIIGHSWGSDPATTIANTFKNDYNNIILNNLHLVDPVKRGNLDTRNIPNKVYFYYPKTRSDELFSADTVATIGGIYKPNKQFNPKAIEYTIPDSTHLSIARKIPDLDIYEDLYPKFDAVFPNN